MLQLFALSEAAPGTELLLGNSLPPPGPEELLQQARSTELPSAGKHAVSASAAKDPKDEVRNSTTGIQTQLPSLKRSKPTNKYFRWVQSS